MGLHDAALDARVMGEVVRGFVTSRGLDGMGLAVSLVQRGEVVYRGTFGYRDPARRLPVTPRTVFAVASITKSLTAAALRLAHEEGRLDLERPLNAERPLLPLHDPAVSRRVSVADVLSHRSGLPPHDLLWYCAAPGDPVAQRLGALELIPDGFRKTFVYNNLTYAALTRVFEAHLGQTWEQAVRERLLEPLGMTRTAAAPRAESGDGDDADDADVALPCAGEAPLAPKSTAPIAPAGGLRSTLDDLSRWLAANLGDAPGPGAARLLAPATLQALRTRRIDVGSPSPILFCGLDWLARDAGYGLGWLLGRTHGLETAFHPGFIDGFSSLVLLLPARRLGLAVLSNQNLSPAPGRLAQHLLDHLLGAGGDTAPPAPPAPAPAVAAETPAPASVAPPAAVFGQLEHPAYGALAVVERHGAAVVQYNGHEWPLTFTEDGAATLTARAMGIPLPLPVRADLRDGRCPALHIPLALDPRVPPQVFRRRATPAGGGQT